MKVRISSEGFLGKSSRGFSVLSNVYCMLKNLLFPENGSECFYETSLRLNCFSGHKERV